MKNFKLIKVIASSLIAISILILNPIGANAQWKSDNIGWWYTEGNSWAEGWRKIDGKYYYFYSDGYMAKDTTIGGDKLGSDGAWVNDGIQVTNITNTTNIPIQIPSIWSKINDYGYTMNNRSALVYDVRDTKGIQNDKVFKSVGAKIIDDKNNYDVHTSAQIYNGYSALRFEFYGAYNNIGNRYCYIMLIKNDKLYTFMLSSNSDNYVIDKQELENVLNTTLVL